MKKKKGFTLIELLAVIVILAVLMVVAVPKILDVIENSRKSAAKSSAELYIDAIEKNNAIANVDSSASKIADGQNMDTRLLNVKVKGTKPKYGTISIEKGKVTNANLCIDGYNVVFENRNAKIDGICDMENIPEYALFDGNGVDSPAPIMKKEGETLGTLPVLTREGYEFLGWFTQKEGGDKITEETVMPSGGATYYAQWKEVKIVCKRATNLHTEECTNSDGSYYCKAAGYTASGSKGTTTITYGNDPLTRTAGNLVSGDAFDCDVDGDEEYGEYDETTGKYTERFYYVSDYYNTTTKAFENDTAVLIYYSNVSGGLPNNSALYRYDTGSYNSDGPRAAMLQLSTVLQWSNVSLKNITRAILNQSGGSTRYGNIALPTAYSYEGYASRLITTQEMNEACGVSNVLSGNVLQNCDYFLENTKFSTSSFTRGYWIENPYSSAQNRSCLVDSVHRRVGDYYVYETATYAVRPAIEVPKENISY